MERVCVRVRLRARVFRPSALRWQGADAGQSTVLGLAVVAVAVLALLALGPMGRVLSQRTSAATAADAAALAGAAEGEDGARRLAEENGGRLLEFRDLAGGEVLVRVAVGDVDACARARGRRPLPAVPPIPPVASASAVGGTGGAGDRAGLAPSMLAALARADRLLGHPVSIASGLRTRAEQQALYDRRHTNPYPVARPGTSDHERGLAVDVPRGSVAELSTVAEAAGLCRPLPRADPVHFVVCGT